MKILVCTLVTLLFGLPSCGRHESPTEGKRPTFHNVSSSHVNIMGVPRISPGEVVPGETILNFP